MIGDLVTGLHGMGGRVQGIQPHNPSEATELALQEVESNDETGAPFQTPRPPSAPSKRSPERKLVQFAAFLRRDVRLHLSYRFAFALGFFGILFNVAVFFYLAQLVTEARVPVLQQYGTDFFPFILIGIAFRGYLGVALNHFAGSLRAEQMMGTLEMLLASPLNLSNSAWSHDEFHFYLPHGYRGGLSIARSLDGRLILQPNEHTGGAPDHDPDHGLVRRFGYGLGGFHDDREARRSGEFSDQRRGDAVRWSVFPH